MSNTNSINTMGKNNPDTHTASIWWLFLFISMILFIKCVIFHYYAFDSILLKSIITHPLATFKFYLPKILVPFFIASFIFISKKIWWIAITNLFIDVWSIANLVYLKTYDSFLSIDTIFLAKNMNGGGWNSITGFLEWKYFIFILLTILLIVFRIYFLQKQYYSKQIKSFFFIICGIFILATVNNRIIYGEFEKYDKSKINSNNWEEWEKINGVSDNQKEWNLHYLPYCQVIGIALSPNSREKDYSWISYYVKHQSIISYFPASIIYHIVSRRDNKSLISLSTKEIEDIQRYVYKESKDSLESLPTRNLILILVESLESWTFEKDIDGKNIAPYLRTLSKQENVLFCNRIKNQTQLGNSGDGQMIINTGLLPLKEGIACMNYSNNTYPNFAHLFIDSEIVNPWPHIWNQDCMTEKYGYKKLIEPNGQNWEDADIFDTALTEMKKMDSPFCQMIITISTHCSFDRIENNQLKFTNDVPNMIGSYLTCINYTDNCIKDFICSIYSDPELSQSIIVITGDHTVFKPTVLEKYNEFIEKEHLSIEHDDNYCPLFIISPDMKQNVYISDICYQMDIYPTILGLINMRNYYWQGFGRNLLEYHALKVPCEEEAFYLSDRIIRSNYFTIESDDKSPE